MMEHPAAHFAILLHDERLRNSLIAEAQQRPHQSSLDIRSRVGGALRDLAAVVDPARAGWDSSLTASREPVSAR
jgi:hypothetical protein